MSAEVLSSRAIIGMYYARLEQSTGMPWVGAISNLFQSDQGSEEYKWLGMAPALREWVGGRNAKGFRDNGITITNKHYEATINLLLRDMTRDKTGQVQARISELADRDLAHWASLLSTLIVNGESTACYDGQFFFDTDHGEGDSGTQSNDISVDISALPAAQHGSVTAPSAVEAQQVALKAIAQIQGFVDDQGEPMNEMARSFVVMTPTTLYIPFRNALTMPRGTNTDEVAGPDELDISVVSNARLSSWTDKIAVFRTDGSVKPLIRQEEAGASFKAKAEGSDYEFDNDAHQYGIDAWRNVGYGYWQGACLATMT